MDGLTEGRIVHFVLPTGEHRPAMIVQVWRNLKPTNPDEKWEERDPNAYTTPENGLSNLTVFTDWTNDLPWTKGEKEIWSSFSLNLEDVRRGLVWATSITYSEDPKPFTWHWIEKA